jgi:hypothetical protein
VSAAQKDEPAAGTAGQEENYVGEKTMPAEIVKVKFYEDELDVINDGAKVRVALRRACENIGLAFQPQIEKLRARAWACITMIVTHDTTGRAQEAMPETLRTVAIQKWLDGLVHLDRRVDLLAHLQQLDDLAKETRMSIEKVAAKRCGQLKSIRVRGAVRITRDSIRQLFAGAA